MHFKHLFKIALVLTLVFIKIHVNAQNVLYPQFEYKNYVKTFSYLFTRANIMVPAPDYSGQALNDFITELNAMGQQGWELISYSAAPQTANPAPDILHVTVSINYTIFLKRKTGIQNVNATIDSIARQYVDAAVTKIQADLISTIDTTIHSVLQPQVLQAIKNDITADVKANFTSAIAKLEAEIAALSAKHQ